MSQLEKATKGRNIAVDDLRRDKYIGGKWGGRSLRGTLWVLRWPQRSRVPVGACAQGEHGLVAGLDPPGLSGTNRIHHCMRLIRYLERALEKQEGPSVSSDVRSYFLRVDLASEARCWSFKELCPCLCFVSTLLKSEGRNRPHSAEVARRGKSLGHVAARFQGPQGDGLLMATPVTRLSLKISCRRTWGPSSSPAHHPSPAMCPKNFVLL